MRYLAVESSTEKMIVVLRVDNRIYTISHFGKKHAETVAVFASELLSRENIEVKDLDFLAVGIGPGTLTGLRVGIGFVIGLAAPFDKKVLNVPSLNLISMNAELERIKVVVRKARKGWVYYQIFDREGEMNEGPDVLEIEKLKEKLLKIEDYILLGDGKDFFEGRRCPEVFDYPLAENLDRYILKNHDKLINYWEIEPLYLQKSIAEINWERRMKNAKERRF